MTKKRTFLVWRTISKAIFQKLKPASENPRAGNRRWIFPETESVLTWEIGERQPLFLAVLKFVVILYNGNIYFPDWTCNKMSLGNYKNLEIKQARKSLRDDSSFPTNNVLIRTLDYTDSSENKKFQCVDGSFIPWSETCQDSNGCQDKTHKPSICGE